MFCVWRSCLIFIFYFVFCLCLWSFGPRCVYLTAVPLSWPTGSTTSCHVWHHTYLQFPTPKKGSNMAAADTSICLLSGCCWDRGRVVCEQTPTYTSALWALGPGALSHNHALRLVPTITLSPLGCYITNCMFSFFFFQLLVFFFPYTMEHSCTRLCTHDVITPQRSPTAAAATHEKGSR